MISFSRGLISALSIFAVVGASSGYVSARTVEELAPQTAPETVAPTNELAWWKIYQIKRPIGFTLCVEFWDGLCG